MAAVRFIVGSITRVAVVTLATVVAEPLLELFDALETNPDIGLFVASTNRVVEAKPEFRPFVVCATELAFRLFDKLVADGIYPSCSKTLKLISVIKEHFSIVCRRKQIIIFT
jgi:hypothetical protein